MAKMPLLDIRVREVHKSLQASAVWYSDVVGAVYAEIKRPKRVMWDTRVNFLWI